MNYLCTNCKKMFEAEEAAPCPNCGSKKVIIKFGAVAVEAPEEEKPTEEAPATTEKKPGQEPYQIRSGKAGWRDFHQSEVRQCIDCGNNDPALFDNDWKHKEKICKKCGAVLPLSRRPK